MGVAVGSFIRKLIDFLLMFAEVERESACVPDLTELIIGGAAYHNELKPQRIVEASPDGKSSGQQRTFHLLDSHKSLKSSDPKAHRLFDLHAKVAKNEEEEMDIGKFFAFSFEAALNSINGNFQLPSK